MKEVLFFISHCAFFSSVQHRETSCFRIGTSEILAIRSQKRIMYILLILYSSHGATTTTTTTILSNGAIKKEVAALSIAETDDLFLWLRTELPPCYFCTAG